MTKLHVHEALRYAFAVRGGCRPSSLEFCARVGEKQQILIGFHRLRK